MEFNFNGQTNIINSQIGNNNTFNNEPLSENDWKNIENFFDQKLKEVGTDSDLCHFFSKSKTYASDKNTKGLKEFFEKNCNEFIKNVLYNMASARIITILSKIGIII